MCLPVAVGTYCGIAPVLRHLGLHQYAGNVYHLGRLGADLLCVFGDYGTAMRACPDLVVLGDGGAVGLCQLMPGVSGLTAALPA